MYYHMFAVIWNIKHKLLYISKQTVKYKNKLIPYTHIILQLHSSNVFTRATKYSTQHERKKLS